MELNHMPAGMELFPSADDSAWNLISDVIEESDYYILIIGGRYGSQDEFGISFTEREYDLATQLKIPIIPLLFKDPEELPRGKTETEKETWEKLTKFRKKVEKAHTCSYWKNVDDLKAKAIVGLTAETKKHPAVGWIRADKIPTDATVTEILKLRKKITDLETELNEDVHKAPKGSEELEQGDDEYTFSYWYVRRNPADVYPYPNDEHVTSEQKITWNTIFSHLSPEMINECVQSTLKKRLFELFGRYARYYSKREKTNKSKELREITHSDDDFNTVVIQLRALGLIKENRKQRSVKDNSTYWSLTPYGDEVMTQLRAIRKDKKNELTEDE